MKLTPLFCLLLLGYAPLCGQQSLFDKAVLLDSLYEQIRTGDHKLAPRVFAEIRELYPDGADLSDAAIYQDVSGRNNYLAPKMNYVHNLLVSQYQEEDNSLADLNAQRDSLLVQAVQLASDACANAPALPDGEPCAFYLSLESLEDNRTTKQLAYFRSRIIDDYPKLFTRLGLLENELYELDAQIDQQKREEASVLRLQADTGLDLLLAGEQNFNQGFTPLVIQSGGGSLQSSVIDGASRWIAERMREELSIAFFDRFEVWMREQRMESLFPSTLKALNITAATDYSLMIQVLRAAFERDLEELPFSIGPFLRAELTNQALIDQSQGMADGTYRAYRQAYITYATAPEDDPFLALEALASTDSLRTALNQQLRKVSSHNQEFNYMLLSIAAIHELGQGKHPASLLSTLHQQVDELFPQGGDIRPALMITDVLARSFISNSHTEGTTWLRRSDLSRLGKDKQLREFFFGLIYHELRQGIRIRRAKLLRQRNALAGDLPYLGDLVNLLSKSSPQEATGAALDDSPELLRLERELFRIEQEEEFIENVVLDNQRKLGSLLNEVSALTEGIDNFQQQLHLLRANNQAGFNSPQLIQLIRKSLDLLRPAMQLALPEHEAKLATIQELSEGILDAYTGVLEKDFNAVVLHTIPVAEQLLDLDFNAVKTEAGLSIPELATLTATHGSRKRKLQEVFRYGAFLAAVAQSRDAKSIQDAIRAIALPTGSYSIKRRNFANVSLNAYPGLTGGYERISNDLGSNWAPNTGFTAPLGLAISWGYRGKIDDAKYLSNPKYRRRVDRSAEMRNNRYLKGSSGSLFFPLLDFGAVVLFRLSDDTSSLPEDVGFRQIFSPGVMYGHGFNNLPLSVLAGVQLSPQLRKFGEEPADALRFNLSVTVDLPMANFHTRTVERDLKR